MSDSGGIGNSLVKLWLLTNCARTFYYSKKKGRAEEGRERGREEEKDGERKEEDL